MVGLRLDELTLGKYYIFTINNGVTVLGKFCKPPSWSGSSSKVWLQDWLSYDKVSFWEREAFKKEGNLNFDEITNIELTTKAAKDRIRKLVKSLKSP